MYNKPYDEVLGAAQFAETDGRTDGQNISAGVELRFATKNTRVSLLSLTEDLLNGGREEEGGGDQGGGQHEEGHGATGNQGPRPTPLLLPPPPVTGHRNTQMLVSLCLLLVPYLRLASDAE